MGVVPGRGQGTSQIRDKEELLNEVKQVLMVQDGCLVNVVTLMPEKMRQSVSRQSDGTWRIPWPVRGAEVDRHHKLNHLQTSKCGAGSENRGRMRDNSQVSH